MAGDSVDIRITATNAQAVRAFRELKQEAAGLRGSLIPLAAAAAPLAAAMAPIAAKAAGAGTAVAAFGAAVAGQVSHLTDAAGAQDKYTDAVTKYGRNSQQAAEAQRMTAATLSKMPQATARAAVSLQTLTTGFKSWSDEMSAFTMTPVERSFAVLGQVIPKLTPMAKESSLQLSRLVTVAGGAVASPGFDKLTDKISTFANKSLKEAVDGAIHFARVLSEGQASGPIKTFMDYAAKNGPALRETLKNVGDAVMTLVKASSEAGPGMLTLVNAAAKLVAALPPQLVATLMQAAVALKAVRLAGAGFDAVAGGVAALSARFTALAATSTAAGGGLVGMRAAFASLPTKAKFLGAAAGIGALVLALHELSDNKAPVEVDALSTSLNTLVSTGKVTGTLSTNFDEMTKSIAMMSKGASDNKFLQMASDFGTWVGIAKGPSISDATKNLDAWDKVMADNVRSGHVKEAAAQYEILKKAWGAAPGHEMKRLAEFTDGYKGALADQAHEQKFAAESMGIFGTAAQDTTAKLSAQKNAADALRQSIFALNDVNRSAFDAETQFYQSMDDLTKAFKDNGATLDVHTDKGRRNREVFSQASKSQAEFIASGVAANESLGSMSKKSDELRATMLKLATEGFDGNKKKAQEYVNTLLGVPSDIKTLVELERKDAVAGLKDVQEAIKKTPGAKSIKVDTLNGAAIKALEKVGLKTKQLPDGKTQVFTANGKALGSIGAVSKALNNLNGKKANTWTYHNVVTNYSVAGSIPKGQSLHDIVGGATGGLFTGRSFRHGYADGGKVTGPGTGTSDDVFAPWLSNGEFVMKKAAVDRYGEKFMQRLNEGRLNMPRFAKGGKVSKQEKAEAEARKEAMPELTISHFGQMAGYQRSEFGSALAKPDSVSSLVNSLNQWAGMIKKMTHGATESKLLKALDATGKKLLTYEKQLNSVNKSLEKAKDKLNDLKSAASQLRDSVKSGILSSANITRGAGGEAPVTVKSIMAGLTSSRDKATSFAQALKDLQAKGLSEDLIRQIAEAGVEGGGLETAGALLGASSSEIASMNKMQDQIVSAAAAAGKTTADAVYGAAIKAQEHYVKSLKEQQAKLTKAMDDLAKVMEKAIEEAIGNKAAGGIVGAAAAGGLRGGLTMVGEQGFELLDLPAGSRVWSNPDSRRKVAAQAPWTSMLNVPRSGGVRRTATPVGGGQGGGGWEGRPIVVQMQLGGRDLGEVIIDPLRKSIRHRGGNVQAALGAS